MPTRSFPNSSTYILAGLELIGPQPDVLALRPRFLASNLESVRRSISTLLSRSYFITSYMGSDLNSGQLRGTLPILYVFLARTGKTIHEVSFVTVKQDGSVEPTADGKDGTRGVKIVFSGPDNKQQTLYYFRTDLANKGVQSSGFLEFCRQFGIGDVFIKAASYLLHTPGFSIVRDFLLEHWRHGGAGRYRRPAQVLRGARVAGAAVRPLCRPHTRLSRKLSGQAEDPVREGQRAADRLRHRLPLAHERIARAAGHQPQPAELRQPSRPQAPRRARSEQPPASEKSPPSAPATPPVVRADKTAPDSSAPPSPPPAQRENAAKQKKQRHRCRRQQGSATGTSRVGGVALHHVAIAVVRWAIQCRSRRPVRARGYCGRAGLSPASRHHRRHRMACGRLLPRPRGAGCRRAARQRPDTNARRAGN